MRRILGSLVAVASLAWASRAAALCDVPRPIAVTPTLLAPAPVNAHVWITLAQGWRERGLCHRSFTREPCPKDSYTLGLRRAPRLGRSRPWIKVTERESPPGRYLTAPALGVSTVELTPAEPLDANTLYEVHLRSASAATDDVVSLFATGDFSDTVAPSWSGAPRGSYARSPRGIISFDACGAPRARFEAIEASDDHAAPEALRFEVRVREFDVPEDLLRVPDAVMGSVDDGRGGRALWLGSDDTMDDDGLLPADGHAVSVSLVIVDWAGNRSPERAFELRP